MVTEDKKKNTLNSVTKMFRIITRNIKTMNAKKFEISMEKLLKLLLTTRQIIQPLTHTSANDICSEFVLTKASCSFLKRKSYELLHACA